MSRLREERGMTLIEMLVALAIGMLICLAAFSLIDFTVRRSGEITGRVDATQRGRLALDNITRQLRSQVCLPNGTPPMFSRTGNVTDNSNATFFVDLSNGAIATQAPELHTLSFDAANRRIVESDYADTLPADPTKSPAYATVTRKRTLLSDVVQNGATPVFTYYTFGGTQLASPVPAADLDTIASIQVSFKALPTGITDPNTRGSVTFQDRVTVREVDPNSTDPEPDCG
jgi:type II secretory pathway component PulJ